MKFDKKIKELLLSVEKPGRYAGNEINAVVKENHDVRFIVCYPDLYEIGMSNNGIQILYSQINSVEGVWGERVFAAAPDFYKLLKENDIPLFSLESRLPVKDADLLGFNLSHEMLYTTMLQILDLSGIPLKSCERSEDDPVIIAGGESVSNPAPVFQFVDLIFTGEGEQAVVEMSLKTRQLKSEGASRKEIIEQLAQIDGVLDTSKIIPVLNSDGIMTFSGDKIKRRIFRCEKPVIPLNPVVSNLRITQDRAIVEVMKGCFNLCKFCHAGYYNLPCRMYDPHEAAETAKILLQNTGLDGISFNSLSISDYKYLSELLNEIVPFLNEKGASISLPSMKVDRATLPIIKIISDVRMTSVTFAVESASEEIRKIIHKRVVTDELLEIITDLFKNGWKTIKLYFMIGLPGYGEYDEIEPMIRLLDKINNLGHKRKNINVTVSPFVPKPHTPFENNEMASRDYFETCVSRLKKSLPRNISIKNHNLEMSELEGIIARGDKVIGDLVLEAYKQGAFLDSWDEFMDFNIWRDVIDRSGIDKNAYLGSRSDENQPWKIIDCANEKIIANRNRKILTDEELYSNRAKFITPIDEEKIRISQENFEKEKSVFYNKLRFRFEKTGLMIYYSHLDIMEIFKRAFRRAEIPLSFSQGFNKREIFHSGYPIPLGVESLCEYLDVDIYMDCDADKLSDEVNKYMPEGLRVVNVIKGPLRNGASDTVFRYRISRGNYNFLGLRENFEKGLHVDKKTKKGIQSIDVRKSVHDYELTEHDARFDVFIGKTESVRIDTLIGVLSGESPFKFEICKTGHFQFENGILSEF
ncbi:MAG: TIGR03960 family B12-binding radical SAM protein [Spirochaetes bacterium]|nr:TIGR03960 family B12-binding radical SAM protein [Spirochaetota bacterium]